MKINGGNMKELKSGTKISGKEIIKLIAVLGDIQYYRVKCLLCNREYILSRESLKKDTGCRKCSISNKFKLSNKDFNK